MYDTIVSVFFFQAEDGIRDLIVTGVQTCALPISRADHRRGDGARLVLRSPAGAGRDVRCPRAPEGRARSPDGVDPHESRSEEHTSELQSRSDLVCRLLLEKKKKKNMHS